MTKSTQLVRQFIQTYTYTLNRVINFFSEFYKLRGELQISGSMLKKSFVVINVR